MPPCFSKGRPYHQGHSKGGESRDGDILLAVPDGRDYPLDPLLSLLSMALGNWTSGVSKVGIKNCL